jgi:hypothetical protein
MRPTFGVQIPAVQFVEGVPGPNLRDAILSGLNLSGVDLRGALLDGADLSQTDLSRATIADAHLAGAILRGADLREANLVNADLRRADLTGCAVFGVAAWGLQLDGAKQDRGHCLRVPGDCGRCRRPGLGIFTTIPSSVCSNRFSRWSSRSTSLAWSKSDYYC